MGYRVGQPIYSRIREREILGSPEQLHGSSSSLLFSGSVARWHSGVAESIPNIKIPAGCPSCTAPLTNSAAYERKVAWYHRYDLFGSGSSTIE